MSVPKTFPSSKSSVTLYGRHAVLSALKNPRRKIIKLLCTKENAAELQEYKPTITERREIDKMLPAEAVHQGFALICQPLPSPALEDIITQAQNKNDAVILILDQVTDPQNIGAIIRSAVAFNVLSVIVQDKNSPGESGSLAKASAGMLEFLPLCRVTNLNRAIEQLKKAGFWIIGMDGQATTTLNELKKGGKNAIIMGSEGKGMRRLIEENCDTTVRLPMNEKVESLNVSVAAAIVLYEMNRK